MNTFECMCSLNCIIRPPSDLTVLSNSHERMGINVEAFLLRAVYVKVATSHARICISTASHMKTHVSLLQVTGFISLVTSQIYLQKVRLVTLGSLLGLFYLRRSYFNVPNQIAAYPITRAAHWYPSACEDANW